MLGCGCNRYIMNGCSVITYCPLKCKGYLVARVPLVIQKKGSTEIMVLVNPEISVVFSFCCLLDVKREK